MTEVAGKSRVNRPFFFRETDGSRMEVPAFGTGQGDLEGSQLREFNMYVRAGQISPADVQFPPENTVLPSITGTARVGETLAGNDGVWTGTPAPTLTRQWFADGAEIPGATGETYVPVEGDIGKTITLTVTATNPAGTVSATSEPTAAVTAALAPPVNTAVPTITGTPTVGQTLSSTTGTWTGNPPPTYARQWKADDADIPGATGVTYELTEAEEGARITVTVTATNSEGSASATSLATDPVAPAPAAPTNTIPPAISGTARVGETLTVTNGTWEGHPAPTYSRQWRRGATDIAGATGTTYTLVEADVGQTITCVVTATNSEGSNTATSNEVGPVAGIAPSFTVDPVLSGTPTVGETLSVTNGTAGGIPAATFTRAWLRDGAEIAGATGTTRVLTEDDIGAQISVRVTATNSAGSDVAVSNELGPVVAPEPDPEPEG